MTPRQIREAFVDGRATFERGRPPEPPPEWPPYRRVALRKCIRAAVLFVRHGYDVNRVTDRLRSGAKVRVDRGVSKQRIALMVRRGCDFLVLRNYIVVQPKE